VGAGGQLLENGAISNPEAAEAVLGFIQEGRTRAVIPETAQDWTSLDGVWNAFISGAAGIANVSANAYTRQREVWADMGFGRIPTRNGLPVTIAQTWAFAILATDRDQRALALDLIQRLLTNSVHAPWSKFANRLPSRRSALDSWRETHAYYEFLKRQLDVAVAIPNGRAFADFSRRFQAAQFLVLRNEKSPQEALLEMRAIP
jgi:ABC-type glycerol-3-phosphate transport system substrate-binding protein